MALDICPFLKSELSKDYSGELLCFKCFSDGLLLSHHGSAVSNKFQAQGPVKLRKLGIHPHMPPPSMNRQ